MWVGKKFLATNEGGCMHPWRTSKFGHFVEARTSLKTPLVFTLLPKQIHEINYATSLKQDARSSKTSLA
jgi:hypothetical protein